MATIGLVLVATHIAARLTIHTNVIDSFVSLLVRSRKSLLNWGRITASPRAPFQMALTR